MNKKTKRTIMLSASLAPFVLLISTTMAIKGLATAPALYFDMKEKGEAWHTYAEQGLADNGAAQSLADTLAPLQNSLCNAADLELSGGLLTGDPGTGAVSAAYVSSCSAVTKINESLLQTVQRQDKRKAFVGDTIEAMLTIPEQDGLPIFERQAAFRSATSSLKQTLADGDAENLEQRVRAQVAVLTNSVVALETKDGGFGDKQGAAVVTLRAQLRNVEGIVNNFLAGGDEVASRQQPDELLSSGAAIFRWWPRLLPQIMLAVGVDLAILWMAAFLAVSRASLREREADLMNKPHWLSVSDLPPWPEALPQDAANTPQQGD